MKLLLKNGLIFDGTLSEPVISDIMIENGIITAIGKDLPLSSDRTIDCTGLMVAPGFIDAHSHNDFFLMRENPEDAILPFVRQGITTQIVGNCGFSAYGVNPETPFKELVGGSLFKTKTPGSLNDFAKALEGKLIQNVIPLVGHGTTRISVAGKNPKPLNEEELKEELSLTEQAMKDGAFGGSFGLMYEPGMYAPHDELVAFARVIKKYNGVLTVHPRANSRIALGYPLLSKPHIEQGLDEVISIMKESGVQVEYSHLIFVGKSSWGCVNPMLKAFRKARAEGYDIAFDMYPFTYGASVITVVLPGWYLKLTKEERRKPFNRMKLRIIINLTKKLLGIDFSDMIISYISKDFPQYEGKTVSEIALSERIKPFDMYLRLVDLSEGKGRMMLGRYYNEDIIHQLMDDELSIYMTDAWYEDTGTQNGGTYQAFPLFLEKTKTYGIPLQETVRKMTGATADRFHLEKRGYLRKGYNADITVFDYDEIKVNQNVPAETPKGIRYVLVNGELTVDHDAYTGMKSGQLLRKKA